MISLPTLLTIVCLTATPESADTLRIPSMEEVQRQNAWLSSSNNPVAVSMNPFHSFSVAEAKYIHYNGNLGWVQQPASSNTYVVHTESFQTFGKVSFYGKLGYKQSRNGQQNWNGMTGNYWKAINLCDSMPGHQQAEQYQLTGAFALPLRQRWLVGASFDYEVQLTAKETDPRNKNQWMGWTLTPGASYLCGAVRLGASLRYASRKETVNLRNMGNHISYPIFASYPLAFFKTLPQGEIADWHYTAQEASGALQIAINQTNLVLFQQVSGGILRQRIESDRILNRSEGETDGWQIMYNGELKQHLVHTQHQYRWQASHQRDRNYEPLQRHSNNGPYESYGRLFRSGSETTLIGLQYRYDCMHRAWQPRFSFIASMDYRQQKSSLLFFPQQYTQSLHRFTLHSKLTRSFVLRHEALFEMSVGGCYGKGGGNEFREKQLTSEETPDIRLWQVPALRTQAYIYETALRWGIQTSATYSHPMPRTSLSWFVQFSGEYEQSSCSLLHTNKKTIAAIIGILF
ncbi:MAG: hypothetical protein RR365_06835 [Bacteroides sp.]